MLPIDVYNLYRARIEYIKRHSHNLQFIEAETSINGLCNIDSIVDILNRTIEEIKSYVAFLREPFEPATLDNYLEALYDAGSQMQVFQQTPSTVKFDSRDIFDADKLKACVDDIFKAITLVRFLPKKIELPANLVKLDLIIDCILRGLYYTILGNTDEMVDSTTLTGHQPDKDASPFISFNKLEKQKYFNDDEQAAIAKREQQRRAAIEEANRRAKLQQCADEVRSVFKLHNVNIDVDDMALSVGGAVFLGICEAVHSNATMPVAGDPLETFVSLMRDNKTVEFVVPIGATSIRPTVVQLTYANVIIRSLTEGHCYVRDENYMVYGSEEEQYSCNDEVADSTILTCVWED